MFWFYLIFSLLVFGLAIWLGINVVSYELNEQGVTVGEDHKFHLPEEQEDISFTYCFKPAVIEAFKVSGDYIPDWAIDKRIEIQILPAPQIIVRLEGKEPEVATANDYVAKNAAGEIWVISEKDIQEGFIKISVEQEECL